MDAVRLKDGAPVILKQVHKIGNRYDQEAEISLYLSSPKLSNDSQNHCIPIYEMLEIPNDDQSAILVMPLLHEFKSPRFDTIRECVDFFQQIFKAREGWPFSCYLLKMSGFRASNLFTNIILLIGRLSMNEIDL